MLLLRKSLKIGIQMRKHRNWIFQPMYGFSPKPWEDNLLKSILCTAFTQIMCQCAITDISIKCLNKMDHILVYCLWRLLNLIFLLRDFMLKINKLTSNWVSLQFYNKLQFYSSIKFHPALILSYLSQLQLY